MMEWVLFGIMLLIILLQLLTVYILWYFWNTYLNDKNTLEGYAGDIRNLALVSLGEQPIVVDPSTTEKKKRRGLFFFNNISN